MVLLCRRNTNNLLKYFTNSYYRIKCNILLYIHKSMRAFNIGRRRDIKATSFTLITSVFYLLNFCFYNVLDIISIHPKYLYAIYLRSIGL